jgi:hypothetical protein
MNLVNYFHSMSKKNIFSSIRVKEVHKVHLVHWVGSPERRPDALSHGYRG